MSDDQPSPPAPARADAAASRRLLALARAVLDHAPLPSDELAALQDDFAQGALTPLAIRDALRCALGPELTSLRDGVLMEDAVDERDRARCRAVVDSLKIPLRLLSPEWLALVLGRRGGRP